MVNKNNKGLYILFNKINTIFIVDTQEEILSLNG